MKPSSDLKKALNLNQIELTAEIEEKIEVFLSLLIEWNTSFNLTAHKREDIIFKDIVDHLIAFKILQNQKKYEILFKPGFRLLDVGAGAGFAGLLYKIVQPKSKVFLVDPVRKKVNFIQQVIRELKLEHTQALQKKVAFFKEPIDGVIMRATWTFTDYINEIAHLNSKLVIKLAGPKEIDCKIAQDIFSYTILSQSYERCILVRG